MATSVPIRYRAHRPLDRHICRSSLPTSTEPTNNWSDDERALLDQLRAGRTIVVSMRKRGHPNLIR
jgi:hypothetical protein